MGRTCAEIFDQLVIRHDKDGRGRTNENITELIMQGIRMVKPDLEVPVISDEREALTYVIQESQPGAFIVACSDEIRETIAFLKNYDEKEIIINN
jgi:cyanophycin synthetase